MEEAILTRIGEDETIQAFEDIYEKLPDNKNIDDVLRSVYTYGWDQPSLIQRFALVPFARGRDCLFQAQSGLGKTGTYLLGAALRIDRTLKKPQVIVIEPTKILAEQTYAVAATLLEPMGISIALHIGGLPPGRDGAAGSGGRRGDYRSEYVNNSKEASRAFTEQVIIGTPGRILDVIEPKMRDRHRIAADTSAMKAVVLDEADQLLTFEFQEGIKGILQRVSPETQAVLVSATMPQEMVMLTEKFMSPEHARVLIPEEKVNLQGIEQYFVDVEREEFKQDTLIDLLTKLRMNQCFVFVNSKTTLERLRDAITAAKVPAVFIHGDVSAMEREQIMQRFRKTNCILVSTDLTSRGIDVSQVTTVINYDVPKYHTTFIHRVGRTGRYGKKGVAITMLTKESYDKYDEICKRYFIEPNELSTKLFKE